MRIHTNVGDCACWLLHAPHKLLQHILYRLHQKSNRGWCCSFLPSFFIFIFLVPQRASPCACMMYVCVCVPSSPSSARISTYSFIWNHTQHTLICVHRLSSHRDERAYVYEVIFFSFSFSFFFISVGFAPFLVVVFSSKLFVLVLASTHTTHGRNVVCRVVYYY